MLNVTQKVFNDIAKNYPLKSEAIQKLFVADPVECDRLYKSYCNQVRKLLPESLTKYTAVVLDALILTVAHNEIRKYINDNPVNLGVLPITETMENAILIMSLEMMTPEKERALLVAEGKKLLEIIN
ncbi:MAG: hypothetical protein KBF15_02990 [Parabacteroides sp.]|nr:hypothetical protein [Parabacteroides sp.]MDD4406081.1 hypothetical protein [Parabacteroides sp.]